MHKIHYMDGKTLFLVAFTKNATLLNTILLCWLVLFSNYALAEEKPSLKFALDLVRHGDRTPRMLIPNFHHHWERGLGQLTAKGMHQEYELGVRFREKYVDALKLLPPHYQRETIYVRSTDFDRTLMSAQSLLFGLYPLGTGALLSQENFALPQGYQPIPIHTVPANDDVLLLEMATKQCHELVKKHVLDSPEWQSRETAIKKFFPHWSEATGIKISSLFDLQELADNLYIYVSNNIRIPVLSEDEANKIIQNGYKAIVLLFKPKEIGKEFGGPLLKMIIKYLEEATQENAQLRYVLLSGHDTSIMGVLSALEAPASSLPPDASHLNFALYETKAGKYFVEIYYNDKPVVIPGCNQNICSLEKLKSVL